MTKSAPLIVGYLYGDGDIDLNRPITEEEIKSAITSMKTGKFPRLDGIPSEFFKHAIDRLLPVLKCIFNYLFDHAIVPIHKKGDSSNHAKRQANHFVKCFLQDLYIYF